MHGDRIVGKETLPILLGLARSLVLLKGALTFIVTMAIAAHVLGMLTLLAYSLIIPPLLLWGIIIAGQRGNMLPGIRMEFRVESLFVLCGILALICTTVTHMCNG